MQLGEVGNPGGFGKSWAVLGISVQDMGPVLGPVRRVGAKEKEEW